MAPGDPTPPTVTTEPSWQILLPSAGVVMISIRRGSAVSVGSGASVGSGVSEASVAVRLRWELRREFAPYVGLERVRKFGETEDLARAAGEDGSDTRLVLGLRFWF